MTNTTVGTAVNQNANGKVTHSVATVNVGDVIVMWTQVSSSTISISSMASSHATWTTYGPWTGPSGMTIKLNLHIGVVTSATTATITATPSATIGTTNVQWTGRQFHTDTGLSWAVEGTPATTSNGAASSGMAMPSQTSLGNTRLAVGLMVPQNNGSVGSTTGYTYRADDYTSIEAYNLNVSTGTVSPATAGQAPNGVYVSGGVVLRAGSVQDVDPTGVATAEAFGTAVVSQFILATGPGTGEAFGTPVVSQNIVGTGIASGYASGSATVAFGGWTLFPVGITSAEAFGTALIEQAHVRAYVGSLQVQSYYVGNLQVNRQYVGALIA